MNFAFGECVGGPFDGARFDEPEGFDGDMELKADEVGRTEYSGMCAVYSRTGRYKRDGWRVVFIYEFIPGTMRKYNG